MKQLDIGTIKVPLIGATKTFAILAKRGAGKTYAAGVMAEEMASAGIPFVVFDPIDVWWGLRLAADGKEKGLPVVVFGQEHADIKLDRDMGRRIAQAVVRERVSCVISTFGLPKVAQRHLIAEFAEELLNINNEPRHVFIEEAHEFVPQRVNAGMGKTFSAVEALVTMGRNRGIGVTLINQRAATVNKDVLTQLDTLIALRNVGPQDRKALHEWVEAKSADGDFDKFMESLPSLPTGEAWVWSPEFLQVFEKIKIRKRETFHPDREKLGHKFVMPTVDQVDIQGFISKFSVTKEPPSKKERTSADVSMTAPVIPIVVPQVDIQALKNEYESQIMEKDTTIRSLTSQLNKIRQIIGGSDSIQSITPTNDSVKMWQGILKNGLAGRLFTFLAEHAGQEFTREQLALAMGVSSSAGHTSNEFAKLTGKRLIVRNGSMYRLNPNL